MIQVIKKKLFFIPLRGCVGERKNTKNNQQRGCKSIMEWFKMKMKFVHKKTKRNIESGKINQFILYHGIKCWIYIYYCNVSYIILNWNCFESHWTDIWSFSKTKWICKCWVQILYKWKYIKLIYFPCFFVVFFVVVSS